MSWNIIEKFIGTFKQPVPIESLRQQILKISEIRKIIKPNSPIAFYNETRMFHQNINTAELHLFCTDKPDINKSELFLKSHLNIQKVCKKIVKYCYSQKRLLLTVIFY